LRSIEGLSATGRWRNVAERRGLRNYARKKRPPFSAADKAPTGRIDGPAEACAFLERRATLGWRAASAIL